MKLVLVHAREGEVLVGCCVGKAQVDFGGGVVHAEKDGEAGMRSAVCWWAWHAKGRDAGEKQVGGNGVGCGLVGGFGRDFNFDFCSFCSCNEEAYLLVFE